MLSLSTIAYVLLTLVFILLSGIVWLFIDGAADGCKVTKRQHRLKSYDVADWKTPH